jgi:hypothetical protein
VSDLPLFPGLQPQRAPPKGEKPATRPKPRHPRDPAQRRPVAAEKAIEKSKPAKESNVRPRLVPFPLVKRRAFIKKRAARIAQSAPATGEKILVHCLRQQAESLSRKGIDPAVVAEQVAALEVAIRCELVRRVPRPRGGAA